MNDHEYLYPAFKFLSKDNASSFLDRGNVHLSPLHSFRDESRYKGKILDIGEGQLRIENEYHFYEGLAKNADGLIPHFYKPYDHVSAIESTWQLDIELPETLIYCATRFLFSDSLGWAKEERKDSCVLITDFDLFVKHVSAACPELTFLSAGQCRYLGRVIREVNPGPQSLSNLFLSHPEETLFVKPEDHKDQREIRATWRTFSDPTPRPVNKDIDEVKPLLLPVDISGIDFDQIEEGKVKLGARIHMKSGDDPAEFQIYEPFGFCSPVLHRTKGQPWFLGFFYPGPPQKYAHGDFQNGDFGIMKIGSDTLLCNVKLENVKSLEFIQSDA